MMALRVGLVCCLGAYVDGVEPALDREAVFRCDP